MGENRLNITFNISSSFEAPRAKKICVKRHENGRGRPEGMREKGDKCLGARGSTLDVLPALRLAEAGKA